MKSTLLRSIIAIAGLYIILLGGTIGYLLMYNVLTIQQIQETYRELPSYLFEPPAQEEEEVPQEVLAPGPIRGETETEISQLTREGILEWTNRHRRGHGHSELTFNTQLNAAAELKVQDMFDMQYFAHDSPDGKGVGDFAAAAGYEHIVIGENLALGNYKDDQTLVQAWMDSPGHRENILKGDFTEIGVAARQGIFEGNTVWLAVQMFGRPLADCPQPNKELQLLINTNTSALDDLYVQLQQRLQELEQSQQQWGPAYNRKVQEYNTLVAQYNGLAEQTELLTNEYNAQVSAFNQCIAQTGG